MARNEDGSGVRRPDDEAERTERGEREPGADRGASHVAPGELSTAAGCDASAVGLAGPAYAALERHFRRLAVLREAADVLRWDMATVMPPGGAAARAEQLAVLEAVAHEIAIDPCLEELLARAGEDRRLDAWQRANLREMSRAWRHATAVPADLVARAARASAECEVDWRARRAANDFAGCLPALREVLLLAREGAEAKAAALGGTPYDALLDGFEPSASAAELDRLFDDLAGFLPELVGGALERQARRPAPQSLTGPFSAERQQQLGERLMVALGFDFAHGRLDVSHHPFCGGVPEDVRLTTRWDESDFLRGAMAVLHETGHGTYERGLPADWRRQPVGLARAMSVHESQSLLVEMQVARSREFMDFLAPLAASVFGGSGPAWAPENLYRHVTRVARSLIRVDADEVTYPAHVILRYRLEKAMVAGDLDPGDLPGAWNEGMRQFLGIAPPDDRDGCLQDVHWFAGIFGYFPTYTLGAVAAAQLFDAARRADPGIVPGIARGELAPLLDWLRVHVHAVGSLLPTRDLLVHATGRPLDPEPYRRHLESRYLE